MVSLLFPFTSDWGSLQNWLLGRWFTLYFPVLLVVLLVVIFLLWRSDVNRRNAMFIWAFLVLTPVIVLNALAGRYASDICLLTSVVLPLVGLLLAVTSKPSTPEGRRGGKMDLEKTGAPPPRAKPPEDQARSEPHLCPRKSEKGLSPLRWR